MKNFNHYKLATWMLVILVFNFNLNCQTTEIIAKNLPGLNGMSTDGSGNLWIIQAGLEKVGGKICVITTDKVIHTAITGLPVFFDWENETQGAWKVCNNGKSLQVLVGGRVEVGGGTLITFDISNWKPGDKPLTYSDAKEINNIGDFTVSQEFKKSDPYRVVWDREGNSIITDAAANAIIKKDAFTGRFSVLHSFASIPITSDSSSSFVDYAPTGIVKNPVGGYYVCNSTGYPFIEGMASIVRMDESGNVTPFVSGLSMLADLDIDAQGNLYALQMGQFDSNSNPIPFTAGVIKITPEGNISTYATGFTPALSSGITVDGKGGFYVNDFVLGNILHIKFSEAIENKNYMQQLELIEKPIPVDASSKLEF